MRNGRVATVLAGVALVALVAGCARPTAGGWVSDTIAAALTPVSELSGIWRGTIGQVAGHQYENEARITLRIEEDGAFSATVTPNGGTNNLAKASTLAGTVVTRGNRVTLRNSEGPWSWVTLVRSGNTLYGVAVDPAPEEHVMLKVERDDRQGIGVIGGGR
jgi:hypothetical protein